MGKPKTDAQRRAENKYHKDKLHIVAIKYTRADFDEVSRAAAAAGVPVASYIREAVKMRMTGGALPEPIAEPERVPFEDAP